MASLQLEDFHSLPQAESDAIKEPNVTIEAVDDSASASSSTGGDVTVDDEVFYPHPTDFKIGEHPIDEIRQLKVAVIGGGLSGITAGALLPVKVPGLELTIFEKNADFVSLSRCISGPGIVCLQDVYVGRYMVRKQLPWSPL